MPKGDLNQEQLAVATSSARRLSVRAGAGTGKTHALAAMCAMRPSERILYATFSKPAQLHAQSRLPPNAVAMTLNGLAFRTHGRPFRAAGKLSDNVRPASLLPEFIDRDPTLALVRARFALEGVREYCYSDLEAPEPGASLLGQAVAAGLEPSLVVDDIRRLWDSMSDLAASHVPSTHDVYFKLWSLAGGPGIDGRFHRLVLDEAQDNNAAADHVFHSLDMPVAYVGDPAQSIYAFRGAIDSLSRFPSEESLTLSGSYRFGSEIAGLANRLLGHFKQDPLVTRGLSGPDALTEIQDDLPFTVICRTNAGVFATACFWLDRGFSVQLLGGYDSYSFGRLTDVHHIVSGHPLRCSDPALRFLRGLEPLERFAKATGDQELKAALRVVKRYGSDIPALVARVRRASSFAEANPSLPRTLSISTAHRAKGLEFEQVLMADDFPSIYTADGHLVPRARASQQEVNLLYVTLTRACTILQPTASLVRLARSELASPPSRLHVPCPTEVFES